MAPKTVNSKKEAGRAKKAENEAKKQAAVAAQKVRVSQTLSSVILIGLIASRSA